MLTRSEFKPKQLSLFDLDGWESSCLKAEECQTVIVPARTSQDAVESLQNGGAREAGYYDWVKISCGNESVERPHPGGGHFGYAQWSHFCYAQWSHFGYAQWSHFGYAQWSHFGDNSLPITDRKCLHVPPNCIF
jgi:hypothetical protein